MYNNALFVMEDYDGFFVVKNKEVNLIREVNIYNYFNGLKTVLDLAEDQIKENNCCTNVLPHIYRLKDIIKFKSDITKLNHQDKANIAFLIWTIYQPMNYLGAELSFIISFFIYFKEDTTELKCT